MIRRGHTVSLRTLLLGLAVAAVAYVLSLILEIALVIAPAAAVNRSHAGALLGEPLAIRQHMNTLQASLDRVGTAFDTTTARKRPLERSEALAVS